MPHDLIEVHEQPSPQHAVDLFLARGIAAHDPFERARLVRRVVIDVKMGMTLPSLYHEIDEALERLLLVCARQRPVMMVKKLTSLHGHVAEKVLKTMLADKGIAFQIKKDVAG